MLTASIQRWTARRICSLISNLTGRSVFCWMIDARATTRLLRKTSLTQIFTKSQPRSLLSIARLNNAKSRIRFANSNCKRIAQISLTLSGGFGSTHLPVFQESRVVFESNCNFSGLVFRRFRAQSGPTFPGFILSDFAKAGVG